ncbi:MAG: hypothetical protein KJ052_04945 [Candidatus Hydrogenedentes bacterium]|nr:hypothetical protein [Candidatus Hydrogenedentota bacterium]
MENPYLRFLQGCLACPGENAAPSFIETGKQAGILARTRRQVNFGVVFV